MPRVTKADFIAPKGQFRIMRESMEDDEFTIVVDVGFGDLSHQITKNKNIMLVILKTLRQDNEEGDVFTLCDENGVTED